MLDRVALRMLRPGFERVARGLHRAGVRADAVTLIGFAVGMAAAVAIAIGHSLAGLVLLLASRVCDGLDGPLARQDAATDRGAFLDITLDFLFYASIPLAFAVADPGANALAAAVLLASFIGTATTFLAFAALAAQRGLHSASFPDKGLYYLGGLTEATETLACFALMCLWPAQFARFAWIFAALCAVTAVTRLVAGWRLLEGRA
jgi:phosphatidylglycerophosphate synthase